jgi:hypothetical protein
MEVQCATQTVSFVVKLHADVPVAIVQEIGEPAYLSANWASKTVLNAHLYKVIMEITQSNHLQWVDAKTVEAD